MIETLRDHTLAWLDSIGSDGLMNEDEDFLSKEDFLESAIDEFFPVSVVMGFSPAYRHADETYHVEPENPCIDCHRPEAKKCQVDYGNCEALANYAAWLAHKEATK